MINRQIISEVRNDLRNVNVDGWIPSQYIYNKLVGLASLFIKREADDKRLFKYTELWSTIKCLEMVEDDLINCCDISIPDCTKVMRSKFKLPTIFSTRYGYLMNVTAVDLSTDYTPVTSQQYKYTKSREYQNPKKRYCWLENGYLIIPDSMVRRVTVKAMFVNKAAALRLNSCEEQNNCVKFLDTEFICPEHLLDDVKTATTTKIAKIYFGLEPDELINQNSTEKTNPNSL
jgi:hypothetical protein